MLFKNLFCNILPTKSNVQLITTIISDIYWKQEEQIIKVLNPLCKKKYSIVHATVLTFGITP